MLSTVTAARKNQTVDDLYALGNDVRAELIDGEIVPKDALPFPEHSYPQSNLVAWAIRRFSRRIGGPWPGGWWLGAEIHVIYEMHQVYCHDSSGWRRDRVREMPKGWVPIRPDWVCEVLSPTHEKRDLVDRMATLHRADVPFYWVIDHQHALLTVYRHTPASYVIHVTAGSGETLRAPPFDAVELRTGVIFGAEDDDP
jgi:Uma2 family endonuclease